MLIWKRIITQNYYVDDEDGFQICLNSPNNDVKQTENSMALCVGIIPWIPPLSWNTALVCFQVFENVVRLLVSYFWVRNKNDKWVDWWKILWPPCEKMRVIKSRSLEIPPLSWNNTVLAFINVVDYQMPGFEINPCRWTSVLWDSTNYLQRHLSLLTFLTSPHCQIPGVTLKCYIEKNPTILHFPPFCNGRIDIICK